LFFLVFLLGTGWAVWNYLEAEKLLEMDTFYPTSRIGQSDAAKERLDAMIAQVETTSQLRSGSVEAVRILEEISARYPFSEPQFDTGAVIDPSIPGYTPVVFVDYPPEITLRGIMIVGNQNVAVMDIPGVGTGIIVRAGDTFMQKKGRVVRIAPDKVVVNWGGKNWDIAPSF